jgi:hypothetical protein
VCIHHGNALRDACSFDDNIDLHLVFLSRGGWHGAGLNWSCS